MLPSQQASAATGVSSSRSEAQIEARSAWDAVAYGYSGAMRPDDLHDDRQTQSGAVATSSLAAPEALEDVRTILHRDARAAVQNTDRPTRVELDDYLGVGGGVDERIFDEIAQGIGNRRGVAGDDDRMIRRRSARSSGRPTGPHAPSRRPLLGQCDADRRVTRRPVRPNRDARHRGAARPAGSSGRPLL